MIRLLARRTLRLTPKFDLVIPKTQGLKTDSIKTASNLMNEHVETLLGPPTAQPKIIILSEDGFLREKTDV